MQWEWGMQLRHLPKIVGTFVSSDDGGLDAILEVLHSIRRAGADGILTYGAGLIDA